MGPTELLALFEASLAAAEGVRRIVETARQDGQITQEQIDAVVARAQASDEKFDALLASLGR